MWNNIGQKIALVKKSFFSFICITLYWLEVRPIMTMYMSPEAQLVCSSIRLTSEASSIPHITTASQITANTYLWKLLNLGISLTMASSASRYHGNSSITFQIKKRNLNVNINQKRNTSWYVKQEMSTSAWDIVNSLFPRLQNMYMAEWKLVSFCWRDYTL